MSFLSKREIILFQGDSVTDGGRNRNDRYNLGYSYPLHVAGYLSAAYQDHNFVFINQGISGDRTCELAARWNDDCIALKPTVVSILVGINDTWRKFDENDPMSVEAFEKHYRSILSRTVNELDDVKLIMLEPFVLPITAEQALWREDLDPKIHVIRKLSREFHALYIPLDGLFAAACTKKSPEYWAGDGVHPSNAGHALIARAWIDAVEPM